MLACDGCGAENRDGAAFCASCGASVARRCPACAREVADDARFCDGCGTALAAAVPPPAAVRKTVTAMFCDLGGSTGFGERVDAETARAVIGRYHAMLQEVVDGFGGTVAKFIGDGMLAFFGIPEVAEDDAERAVAAAAEMQRRFTAFADAVADAHGERLTFRIGVNSGEVVIGEGDADVVGDALNVAARLEKACEPGRVLVGEATWRLTRSSYGFEPLGEVTVTGRAEPVAAFALAEDERPDAQATPFVGREGELGRLRSALHDAVTARSARFVSVIGPPGVGKTRLSRELEASLDDGTRVLHTACERAGGSTFGPLVELIRPALGEEATRESLAALVPPAEPEKDRVVDGLAGIVGLGEARSTEETFWALRRLVESLAADRPLVLVIDDIQWAEARLLDLLEHLAEWVADAPVLLLGLARPELRELRPALAEPGRRVADVLVLDGLDDRATAELAGRMLGGGGLPPELVARLPASTDGNPLFVRELVRMLVDEGVIRRDGDEWRLTVDADAVEVPPTIRSLLAARVERLPAAERTVLERASVVGPDFVVGALRELVDDPGRLDSQLESLRRRDLVEPTGSYWGDDPVWRFHHVLIRDAVYGRLLKEVRADLHERVGDWTAAAAPRIVGEHETTIAHHYEQAFVYRSQLGALDEHGQDLGRRAAELLATAARRAMAQDDLVAAGSLALRALACRADTDDDLLRLALEALLASGESAEVPRLLDTLGDEAWADIYRAQWLDLTDATRLDEAQRLADGAAERFAAGGDQSGQAKAHLVRASLLARRGRLADSEIELDHAMGAARQVGDDRRLVAALGAAPAVALWGPSPVARAGGRCLDVIRLLRITTASPVVEATSLRHQAVLEALRGRTEPARKLLAGVRSTVEELGLRRDLMEVELFEGIVDLLDGDAASAEPHLRAAYDGLTAIGAAASAGAGAWLARALLAQGRIDDADALEAPPSDEDLKAAIAWRSVRAELRAGRGEMAEAVALAEEAVALAAGTDFLLDHADALAALATVRRAAGDAAGAATAESEARRRYEEKGSTVHGADTAHPVAPSPPPTAGNAAARHQRELNDRWQAEGPDAIADMFSADYLGVDRRRVLGGEIRGPEEALEQVRVLAALLDGASIVVDEVVAERGERVALVRMGIHAGFEAELLVVTEIDADGRQCFTANYDVDDLDSAMAELEERHRALTGNAAVRHNRELHARWQAEGPDAVAGMFSPTVRQLDRRSGLGGEVVGREAAVEQLRAADEVLGGARIETREVLAQRGDRLALLREGMGGDVEIEWLAVIELDEQDRQQFSAIFDVADLDAAMAELDRRHAAFGENLAARATRALLERWMNEGPDGVLDGYVPSSRIVDRRQGLSSELVGREEVAAQLRAISELKGDDDRLVIREVVAQRGELLLLFRQGVDGDVDVEMLTLVEVDPAGRQVLSVQYDLDDLDTANAELDERHEALAAQSLAARQARGFVATWMVDGAEAAAERFVTEGYRWEDRRQGLGTVVEGRDALLEMLAVVADVFPPGAFENTGAVAQRGERLALVRERITADVEIETLVVAEVDDAGLLVSGTVFDPADLDAATAFLDARDAELSGENLAVRTTRVVLEQWQVDGVDAALGHYAPEVRFHDRRTGLGSGEVGRDGVGAQLQAIRDLLGATRFDVHQGVIAQRGDRLALLDQVVAGDVVIELLSLVEVDESGRYVRIDWFDHDDRSAALEALDARCAEMEHRDRLRRAGVDADEFAVMAATSRALGDGDATALDELLADDVVFVDHRPLGLGQPDREGLLAAVGARASTFGAPTAAVASEQIRLDPGSCLFSYALRTRNEQDVDVEVAGYILHVVRDRLVRRIELFGEQDRSAAEARYDELRRGAAGPTNRAAELQIELTDRWMTRGADAAADLIADDVRNEDRRTGLQASSAGREAQLAGMRAISDLLPDGERFHRLEVVAVRGDRLVLARYALSGDLDVETLNLGEFDEAGRLVLSVSFDPDDLVGAQGHLNERFARGEGAAYAEEILVPAACEDAMRANDRDALASLLAEDFVSVDHRRIGYGELDRDGWLAWMAARPDTQGAGVVVATELVLRPNLALMPFELRARSATGVEQLQLGWSLVHVQDGQLHRTEVFAEDEQTAAEARFDELSALATEPLVVRVYRRQFALLTAGDMDAVLEGRAVNGVTEDRRRGMGSVTIGREANLTTGRVLYELLGGATFGIGEVVDHRGEHLALVRLDTIGALGPTVQSYAVIECNADELTTDMVVFDLEALDEARAELERRVPANRAVTFGKAFNERWMAEGADAIADLLAEDMRFEDHRAGLRATLDGRDACLAHFRAVDDLIPADGRVITGDVIAHRGDLLRLVTFDAPLIGIQMLSVAEFDDDGRLVFNAMFDVDDLAEAQRTLDERFLQGEGASFAAEARFDELSAASGENLAARRSREFTRRWMAEGPDVAREFGVEGYRFVDHRAGLQHAIEGIDGFIENLAVVDQLRQGDDEYRIFAVVAQRGERLVLVEQGIHGSVDVRNLFLHELDDSGRAIRGDNYEWGDLAEALDELDRRFAAGEGAAHAEAVGPVTALNGAIATADVDLLDGLIAEDFVYVDHQLLHRHFGDQDRSEFLAGVGSRSALFGRGLGYVTRFHRIERGCVLVAAEVRTWSDDGMESVEPGLAVNVIEHGRITLLEVFPPDDLAAAEARFAELAADRTPENQAGRRYREFVERWMAEGADAVRDLLAERYRFTDHRRGMGSVIEGVDAIVENLRNIEAMLEGERFEVSGVVAWRGERLALVDRGVDSERAVIRDVSVVELDAEGQILAVDLYDTDDLVEALAELDRRYAEGEGRAFATEIRLAASGGGAIASGDADALGAMLTDDFVFIDHRPIGWGGQDRDSYLAAVAARPDTLGRGMAIDREMHLRPGIFMTTHEIRTDKDVAKAGITVATLRGELVDRIEVFAEDDRASAEARFDELAAGGGQNLATRSFKELVRHWMAEGAEAARHHVVEAYRLVDHRKGFGDVNEGVEAWLANLRTIDDLRGDQDMQFFSTIAQRGQRLALLEYGFEGDIELRFLWLGEVDAQGRGVQSDVYDADDLQAAIAELDQRFLAGEGAPHADDLRVSFDANRMISVGDVAGLETLFAEDFVYVDKAPLRGWLGEVQRAEYLAGVALRLETFGTGLGILHDVLRSAPGCHLITYEHRSVTPAGVDALEAGITIHCVSQGRITRQEVFGESDRAAAEARFEELAAEGRGATDRGAGQAEDEPPGNLAARMGREFVRRWVEEGPDAIRAVLTPDFLAFDHRRGLGAESQGPDALVENLRMVDELRGDDDFQLFGVLAQRGERLALLEQGIDGAMAVRTLLVTEVDESGLRSRSDVYDREDLVTALDELDRRYLAGEGAPSASELGLAFACMRANGEADVEALAGILSDDFVYVDRVPMRSWIGEVDRATYLAGLARRSETFGVGVNWCRSILRSAPGCHLHATEFRTQSEAGVEASEVALAIFVCADGRITHMEAFGETDLAAAEARFEALAAESADSEAEGAPALANAATRRLAPYSDRYASRDWDWLRELFDEHVHNDDRRTGANSGVSVGRDRLVELTVSLAESGFATMRQEPVAVRGEHLVLYSRTWEHEHGFELALLALMEIDADGHLLAHTMWDPDDWVSALDELDRRYLVDAEHPAVMQVISEWTQLMAKRAWDATRPLSSPSFRAVDHRPVGHGELDYEARLARDEALAESVPGAVTFTTDVVACGPRAALLRTCWLDTSPAGAGFGTEAVTAFAVDGEGRVERMEIFADTDMDAARARYEELEAEGLDGH